MYSNLHAHTLPQVLEEKEREGSLLSQQRFKRPELLQRIQVRTARACIMSDVTTPVFLLISPKSNVHFFYFVQDSLVGRFQPFDSPLGGNKPIVYADWTASGRQLHFIEVGKGRRSGNKMKFMCVYG